MAERVSIDDLLRPQGAVNAPCRVERRSIDDVIIASKEGRGISNAVVMEKVLKFTDEKLNLFNSCFKHNEKICDEIAEAMIGDTKEGRAYISRRSYRELLTDMERRGTFCMVKDRRTLDGTEPQPPAGLLFKLSLMGCCDLDTLFFHSNNDTFDFAKVHGENSVVAFLVDSPHSLATIPGEEEMKRLNSNVYPFLKLPTADYMDCLIRLDEACVKDNSERSFFGTNVLFFREEEEEWRARYGRPRTVADALITAMNWLYFAQGDLLNIQIRELAPTNENKAYYKTKCAAETVWTLLVTGPLHIMHCHDKFL